MFVFDNQTKRLLSSETMNLAQYAAKTKISPADFRLLLKKVGMDVSDQAVHWWFTGRRQPSPKRMDAIEKATRGAVTRYHQRPDIYGVPKAKRRAA